MPWQNPVMALPEFLRALHRKTVRHYDLPGHAHFLTFSCFQRLPLLSKDRTRKWFVEALSNARRKHGFDLWAWVIMPEHVHLLLNPASADWNTAAVLADIKRPVGQRAINFLIQQRSPFLAHLTVRSRNRTYRRFWQAGPGQDHNINDPATAHRVIESVHNNPVRRGLVLHPEDWYWSSCREWCGATDIPIRIDRTLPAIAETASH
jgi:putative transposase